jgi:cobalt-zinc-cadmium efflux system outer membrane protein
VRRAAFALAGVLASASAAHAQTGGATTATTAVTSAAATTRVTAEDASTAMAFSDYLALVGETNLDLFAGRAGVDQAEARIDIARVFPSPRLSGGLAAADVSGNQGNRAATLTSLQVDVPIELGGRRERRIDVAAADHARARAELEASLAQLRADAASRWIDALTAELVLGRRRRTLESLHRLVEINEMRFGAGAIGEIPVVQSRVEAQRYQGEVLGAEGEAGATATALLALLGDDGEGRPREAFSPIGELDVGVRTMSEAALVTLAMENRSDLAAAERALEGARARRALTHAQRWPDLTLSLNWTHSFQNLGSPSYMQPEYDTVGVLAAIEIPLRLLFDGDLREAEARIDEAELTARALRLRITVEIRSALRRYEAARARLELYEGRILEDAERVLDAAQRTYERGGGSLLEVLVAQRTVDEVFLDYYAALAEHARVLAEIDRLTGTPQLTF